MNRAEWMRVAGLATVLALAAFGPGGCSNSDSPDTSGLDDYFATHPFLIDPRTSGKPLISITPTAAQVNQVGGKAVFTASGGSGSYTWDVANRAVGDISGSGAQGVYTAISIGNNDVIVSDGEGNAALAKIGGTGPAALSVSADPATLDTDRALSILKASGGQSPYLWTRSSGSGNFDGPNTGDTVVYVRYSSGDNAVTVTDSLGNRASLVIKQP